MLNSMVALSLCLWVQGFPGIVPSKLVLNWMGQRACMDGPLLSHVWFGSRILAGV